MLKVKKSIIILVAAALVLALVGGGKILYLVFYMLSGVFLISYIWSSYTSRNISAYHRFENKEYYVDDNIKIQTFIDNNTLLPIPYVEITDRTIDPMGDTKARPNIVSLMPMEREFITSDIQIKYRGVYDIGPLEFKISDVFGAFTWYRKIYSNSFVKVYPRVYNITKFNLKSMQSYGTLSTKNKAFEDNTSISDIRKYSIGDSVKKIHWKVTAKKRSLHVKNFEMTGSVSTYIFLDLKNDSYIGGNAKELEERAVETASTLAAYFLKNAVSIEMYVNTSKLQYTKGRDIKELRNFLDMLCEINSSGYTSMKDIVEKRIGLMTKGSSVIMVVGRLNLDETRIYCSIKQLGFDFVLVYVCDTEIEKNILQLLNNYEIKIYVITSYSDIKGVLQEK